MLTMICVCVWLENSTVVALFINQFSSSFFFLSTITFLESIVEHTHTRPTQSVFLSFFLLILLFGVRCQMATNMMITIIICPICSGKKQHLVLFFFSNKIFLLFSSKDDDGLEEVSWRRILKKHCLAAATIVHLKVIQWSLSSMIGQDKPEWRKEGEKCCYWMNEWMKN